MKPGFALALSFDGIALLHLAAGEWQLIGEVAADAPDLESALADLRKRALALDPDGPHCKIIIPDEQIRYLSVETGLVDLETRDQVVRAELEGTTPYAVADLQYDISVQGSLTHVAAVARETLIEARKFALTHGFVPVSFVASPTGQAFSGEAFFDYGDPAADPLGNEGDTSDIPHEQSPEAPATAGVTDTPKAPLAVDPVSPTRPVTTEPEIAETDVLAVADPKDEAAHMTALAARRSLETRDSRRLPVLPIGIGAVLLLAALAVWAMFSGNDSVTAPKVALQNAAPETVQIVEPVTPEIPTETDTAALDAQHKDQDAPEDSTITGELLPETPYATPQEPDTPAIIGLGDLYIASIDRTDVTRNAVNLPASKGLQSDTLPGAGSPATAERPVALDPNGLVKPTSKGTLNPKGVLVYLGRPPVTPPAVPTRFEAAPKAETEATQLAAMRPRLRPENLAPEAEPAEPEIVINTQTGNKRPPMRPESLAAQVDRLIEEQLPDILAPAAAEPEAAPDDATATALAILNSPKPNARPGDLAATAKKPEPTPVPQQTAAVAAPVTVVPKIPSSASVAQQATQSKALNLRQVNLIGVYGPPANRRALVRLSNGRYKKVKIGDSVDGGRVVAIGENNVHYQKGGRAITLAMPSG